MSKIVKSIFLDTTFVSFMLSSNDKRHISNTGSSMEF